MLLNRSLRHALILVLICMATFSVSAQDFDPTATPRPSTTTTVLTEVSDAVDRIGIFNFVSAGLIIIAGLAIWQGLKPLIQHGTDAGKRADDVTRQLVEMTDKLIAYQEKQSERESKLDETRRAMAESLAQTVKAQEGVANIMSQMETKQEAQENRKTSVHEINEHTTEVMNTVNKALEQVSQNLEQVQTDLQSKLTQKDFDDGIEPIVEQLKTISSQVSGIHERLSNLAVPNVITDVTIATGTENKEK